MEIKGIRGVKSRRAFPKVRNSINSVRNLLVDTPNGNHVRIAEVADVRENPTLCRPGVKKFLNHGRQFQHSGR